VIGRYVEADPVGIEKGKNHLFVYVENSPVNKIDLFGLACGSGITDAIVPDTPAGYNFTICCSRHDKCYSGKLNQCNKSREQCDKEFFDCMDNVCWKKYPFDRTCKKYSKTYYKAVCKLGGPAFRKARKKRPCCQK
jgi:hypothetical protein